MVALIVDDAQIMRVILKDMLVKYCGFKNHEVVEADDGTEAIKKYKEQKPDIVFLDIHMPQMDGMTAVVEMIKIDSAAKIVMCTAVGDGNDVMQCIKAGAKDYVKKPPSPERIVQAIESVTGKMIRPAGDKPEELSAVKERRPKKAVPAEAEAPALEETPVPQDALSDEPLPALDAEAVQKNSLLALEKSAIALEKSSIAIQKSEQALENSELKNEEIARLQKEIEDLKDELSSLRDKVGK